MVKGMKFSYDDTLDIKIELDEHIVYIEQDRDIISLEFSVLTEFIEDLQKFVEDIK